jgi:ribosomal protein S27E
MPIQLKCPGCQTAVTLPRHLAGKRARCPRCNTVFSTPGISADANESEAIVARPSARTGPDSNAADAMPFEPTGEWAGVRIQLQCDGCGHTLSFAASEVGTVQECPECGGYIDVPELGRPPTTAEIDEASRARTAREWELQSQETTRQLAINAKQIEQAQRALDRRDQQDDRYDQLLNRFERVLALWEELAEQVGRIIERMDR